MYIEILIIILLLYVLYHILFDITEHYMYNDPMLDKLKLKLSVIDPNIQHINIFGGPKSYTVNKRKIYICMKDEYGRYYDENMLIYVICHEYAHMLCRNIGHSGEFPSIFQNLLDKAQYHGLYNPNIPPVKNYCERGDYS